MVEIFLSGIFQCFIKNIVEIVNTEHVIEIPHFNISKLSVARTNIKIKIRNITAAIATKIPTPLAIRMIKSVCGADSTFSKYKLSVFGTSITTTQLFSKIVLCGKNIEPHMEVLLINS